MSDNMTFDPGDYWKIKAQGLEWIWMVQKMIKSTPGDDPTGVYLAEGHEAGELVYYLKRERYPAQVVERYTGIPAAQVEAQGQVRLSITPNPDLPHPTVGYHGEA